MPDSSKKFAKKLFYVTLVLFCVRCCFSRQEILTEFDFYSLFGYAGEAVTMSLIIMTLYEKYFWKYNPFEKMPVLRKKYVGELIPTCDRKGRSASIEIKQTLLTVSVTMRTGESSSKSSFAIIQEVNGVWQLVYNYTNTPNASVRERSEIHHGTGYLDISSPTKLQGQYYTDRKTTGDMEFVPDNIN